MASVSAQLRDSSNSSTVDELEDATNIEFATERNSKGRGSFQLRNNDPAAATLTSGSIVRFLVNTASRFVARVVPRDVTKVSVSDEGQEAIEYECEGVLVDWERDVVQPSAIQCDFVPSLDERFFNIYSGEHEPDVAWEYATEIAVQGWGSTFYTGQPAGWTDPDAKFLWSSHGDDDDAPAGRCIFKEPILVNPGKKVIEWGADNVASLYLNGKKINEGSDFRKKQTYEFETTSGFLTIAFDVVNVEDDGPPGGNPGAVIGSLREGGPDGTIIWRTSNDMRVLPYPTSLSAVHVGEIIRRCLEESAVNDNWDVHGVGYNDCLDVPWPTVESVSFRFYTDTLLDVLKSFEDVFLDFKVGSGSGLEMFLYNKGTAAGTPSTLDLVAGYADEATDSNTNVTELEWRVKPPEYQRVALRWSDGWVLAGSGNPIVGVRAEQIKSADDAAAVAAALLDVYSVEQRSAAFSFIPLNETTDLPYVAFDVFDDLDIPGDGDLDTKITQSVRSIAVSSVDATDEAAFVVTVGDPIEDDIEILEAAIKRGAPGLAATRGVLGSPSSGSQVPVIYGRASSPGVGEPSVCVASAPNAENGAIETAPVTFVGQVNVLRLYGVDSSGTSTVEVTAGSTTYTLSGSGDGLVDYVNLSGVSWDRTTMVTVEITALGHRSLHVFADVAEVSA